MNIKPSKKLLCVERLSVVNQLYSPPLTQRLSLEAQKDEIFLVSLNCPSDGVIQSIANWKQVDLLTPKLQGLQEMEMLNQRDGEATILSNHGPDPHQPLAYGIHSSSSPGSHFFDQGGAAYLSELEEALKQGVLGGTDIDEGTKSFLTTRPPTFEIWPLRFQQTTRSVESSGSGSAQNSISNPGSESAVSRKASSIQYSDLKQQEVMIASDSHRIGIATNHQSGVQEKRRLTIGSTMKKDGKVLDAKTLRRLAQNRVAAKKSRLRKKAYVQQLECSRIRLQHLEHELQRARSQVPLLGACNANTSSGAAMFDMEYTRWSDENYKLMSELRAGLQADLTDHDLRFIVDECLAHYDELFHLKSVAAKSDAFHVISGSWLTPIERCFVWMGGFRPSELLKILIAQLDPFTEQQLMLIYTLQQSSQQAEEALSQGREQLQQSLADTVASGPSDGTDSAYCMDRMTVALGRLADLEGFVRQADSMRQQTLHQMCRMLTIRQAARCFLSIGEYTNRLRALSSLWASRLKE